MENIKYLKVVRGTGSSNGNFEYKIDEVNVANNWNSNGKTGEEMGGFNFSREDKILRWLVRGNILYDVIIPKDAEVIDVESSSFPHGVFRTNKIILTNPRALTDDIAMDLYLKSDLPEKSYYKSLAGLIILGFKKTCLKLIEDRVNKDNAKEILGEIDDFCNSWHPRDLFDFTVFDEIYEMIKKLA